jgi:hypothetical protein
MPSEINQMNDLDRSILDLLMQGWQTTDYAKTAGLLTAQQIASHIAVPIDDVIERLILLETLGYITNAQNYGEDPTVAYKGIEEGRPTEQVHEGRYHISENGKRLVLAGMIGEESSQET